MTRSNSCAGQRARCIKPPLRSTGTDRNAGAEGDAPTGEELSILPPISSAIYLPDDVPRHAPRAVGIPHRSDRFGRALLMLERCFELDHYVLAVWRAGERLGEHPTLERSRFDFTER